MQEIKTSAHLDLFLLWKALHFLIIKVKIGFGVIIKCDYN